MFYFYLRLFFNNFFFLNLYSFFSIPRLNQTKSGRNVRRTKSVLDTGNFGDKSTHFSFPSHLPDFHVFFLLFLHVAT